ncbi:SPW repeat protein [Streptomyces sp. TRM70350]|uniref:SPW repeat protein n=1 Tax=Streptomyces sp. TRM70350 TaxID=2856165 RepID=UPI001C470616|nr:SPW repeat protein [Streptomyces sp. TRM70350]MBV7697840.1 SPW repeat protein [Streptomyces sp. TRM70350]
MHSRIEEHPDIQAMRARAAAKSAKPSAQATEGLTLLAGLYLAISPWVVGFNGNPLAVSNLVTGIALAVLALGFGSAFERTFGMGWAAAAIGAWAIIAPWVIQNASTTTGTIASNTATGALAVVLGLMTTAMARGRA